MPSIHNHHYLIASMTKTAIEVAVVAVVSLSGNTMMIMAAVAGTVSRLLLNTKFGGVAYLEVIQHAEWYQSS